MDAPAVHARLQALAAAFNRGTLDVPDGTIDRACSFRLNGTTYADTMGRPTTSPLVRMVAFGPAAYRFLSQAIRYAMPDVQIDLGDVTATRDEGGGLATGVATVSGTFRGREVRTEARVDYAFVLGPGGAVTELGVRAAATFIEAIAEARRL